MNKELIIPRKKAVSIKASIGMFLAAVFLAFPILLYFVDIPWIAVEKKMPFFLAICCMLCAPLLLLCSIFYLKEIFNHNPILIINSSGIREQTSANSVGLIRWEHIEKINIIPQADKTPFIGIILNCPEIYIENPKLLAKLNKQQSTKAWGHIRFSAIYFKKELPQVLELMRYYYELHHPSAQL